MRLVLAVVLFAACAHGIEGAAERCSVFQVNRRTVRVTSDARRDSVNHEAAMLRAAQCALSVGYAGFVILDDDTGVLETQAHVRGTFRGARASAKTVTSTTITVGMLTRDELTQQAPGTTVYDAQVIVGQYP